MIIKNSLNGFRRYFCALFHINLKDIESHAENKNSSLNQTQLQRLYMVLKPFMLRREKKDVLNEMPPKTEIKIRCNLTPRQVHLYTGIK